MGSTNFCGIIKFKKSQHHSLSISNSSVSSNNSPIQRKKTSDDTKYASIELTQTNLEDGYMYYKLRDNLVKTQQLIEIQEYFQISDINLNKLWIFFKQIDKNKIGFITIYDLYRLLDIKMTSFMAPFLDRFYINISKEFDGKILFEELIPNLISFCLFSPDKIIEFIFNMIDKNNDGFVKKSDIIKLILLKRESESIFIENSLKAVEDYTHYKRGDRISLEEFVEMSLKLTFIIFPAMSLQTLLRNKCVGNSFWDKLRVEIKAYANNQVKIYDRKRIEKQIEKVKDKVFVEKRELFLKRIKAEENMEKMNREKIYKMELRVERKKSDTLYYLDKIKNEKKSFKDYKEELDKKRKVKIAKSQVFL